MKALTSAALTMSLFTFAAVSAHAQSGNMNFFITSTGPGNGADLGGLAGADAHCAFLGYNAGFGDRTGGGQDPTSWNSAHASRGCSQQNLQATGGNGLFYCFAI